MVGKLSKIDAARRQILAAIHIHWYLDEPLAVYTLAANAREVADALLKKAGRLRFGQAFQQAYGVPERALRDEINALRNFVKHADRTNDPPPDEVDTRSLDTLLMIACLDYMVLVGRQPMIFDMFMSWYAAIYPDGSGPFYREQADHIFPELAKADRAEQLVAARFVANQLGDLEEAKESDMTDDYRWSKLRGWSANERTSTGSNGR